MEALSQGCAGPCVSGTDTPWQRAHMSAQAGAARSQAPNASTHGMAGVTEPCLQLCLWELWREVWI